MSRRDEWTPGPRPVPTHFEAEWRDMQAAADAEVARFDRAERDTARTPLDRMLTAMLATLAVIGIGAGLFLVVIR